MFGEDLATTDNNHSKAEKEQSYKHYTELKHDYNILRERSLNGYDFYNLIEKSVLEMEGEETNRISDEALLENGMKREDLQKLV